MANSTTRKPSYIDCLLAIDDAGFPAGQKILPSSMLLAYVLATKADTEIEGQPTMPQLFIAELRKLLENPRPSSTQEIIEETQKSIDELMQQTDEIVKNPKAKAFVLTGTLSMLQNQFKKEAQSN